MVTPLNLGVWAYRGAQIGTNRKNTGTSGQIGVTPFCRPLISGGSEDVSNRRKRFESRIASDSKSYLKSEKYLVDVSDIFFFFLLHGGGGGGGVRAAGGRGMGSVFIIENPGGG